MTWKYQSIRRSLTVVRGVDDIKARKGHHNVMDGVLLGLLGRQHMCGGFTNTNAHLMSLKV